MTVELPLLLFVAIPETAAATVAAMLVADILRESLLRRGDTNHGHRQTHGRHTDQQDTPRAADQSGIQSILHSL